MGQWNMSPEGKSPKMGLWEPGRRGRGAASPGGLGSPGLLGLAMPAAQMASQWNDCYLVASLQASWRRIFMPPFYWRHFPSVWLILLHLQIWLCFEHSEQEVEASCRLSTETASDVCVRFCVSVCVCICVCANICVCMCVSNIGYYIVTSYTTLKLFTFLCFHEGPLE